MQDPIPDKPDIKVQQEVGRNDGQGISQMNGSQAYHANGDIHIHETVPPNNILLQAVSSAKKEIPSLLPYLANRSEQEFELRQAIQTHQQQPQNRPLLCIIHGDEHQCHDKFLERLQKVSLPRLLKLDLTQAVIKNYLLSCPSAAENPEKFDEYLRHKLGEEVEHYSFASKEEINQTFCKYPYPVIIHTHLLTQNWEGKGVDSLYNLLDFWNNWTELAINQQLIICISIKYESKEFKIERFLWLWKILSFLKIRKLPKCHLDYRLNETIIRQLDEISQSKFSRFENLNGVVLPELSGISRSHVEDWVRQAETKEFIGETMVAQFMKSVRKIFEEREDSAISMENLADELIKLLEAPNIC